MRAWQHSNRDYSVHSDAAIVVGPRGTPPVGTSDLFPGTGGDDNLTGTTGDDTFDLTAGGNDRATGLEGNDTFDLGAAFTAFDRLDGGDGNDTLNLDGDYSAGVTMRATTLVGIENIHLAAGHSYNLTANDAAVAQPLTIAVDGSALGSGDVLIFDGHKETDGSYSMTGGAGDDVLIGAGGDVFYGNNGNDLLVDGGGNNYFDGGNGNDTISYAQEGPMTVDLFTNHSNKQGGSQDNIYHVENVIGSGYGDVMADDAANNNIYGGKGNDGIYLFRGGNDTGKGGAGDDSFVMGNELNIGDRISGGGGYDSVNLSATVPMVLANKTFSGIELLIMHGSGFYAYDITSVDKTVGNNKTLTISGGDSPDDGVRFDGSAETNGHFVFNGSHGHDVFLGGMKSDTLNGRHAADTLTGGAGGDTFQYEGISDSYYSSFDDITDFDAASDNFDLWFAVSGVDAGVSCADLGDLSTAADAAHLAAGHTLVATVGTDTFLVVDANAADGYQVGEDLLVRINGATNLGDLTAGDFI